MQSLKDGSSLYEVEHCTEHAALQGTGEYDLVPLVNAKQ